MYNDNMSYLVISADMSMCYMIKYGYVSYQQIWACVISADMGMWYIINYGYICVVSADMVCFISADIGMCRISRYGYVLYQ